MSIQQPNALTVFDEAKAAIPSCAATPAELRHQRERQARLAPGMISVEGTKATVVVSFAENFDRTALDEMVAVERRCCPFFVFDFDETDRRLMITVREPDQRPALAALAAAFESDPERSRGSD